MTHEEKAREEAKRDRMYDPVQRWKDFQDMVTWLEARPDASPPDRTNPASGT
jgi:hypothetical protein